jgi:hypothetical protein
VAPGLVLFIVLLALPALLHRVALAGDRHVTAKRWRGLPQVDEDDARRGYKTAQVLVAEDGSAATLSGITLGGSYRAEDRARCARRGCAAPGLDCECGFYAFKRRADALDLLRETLLANGLRHKALLTVELEGTVLQYEKGYRAERQRVLGVQLERICAVCRVHGHGSTATVLAASRQFRLPTYGRLPGVGAAGPATAGWWPVRPVCAEHVPDRSVVLGPSDLAGLLGTEVTWLP